jgi:hypothetical protein
MPMTDKRDGTRWQLRTAAIFVLRPLLDRVTAAPAIWLF